MQKIETLSYTESMSGLSVLVDPTLTIIFATSPTGLGHLRVTDALYHGLPKGASPVLLGAQDPSVSSLYRFVSIHPLTRRSMELLETPPLDKPFARIIRPFLRKQSKMLYQQLKTILSERFVVPKTVLLVASHTILGHQLGAIKQQLAKELGITILLVVQVTDDSPQPISYIYDADLILVPSEYTKEHLSAYAHKEKLPLVPLEVTAYPISPLLTEELSEHALEQRLHQTDPASDALVHMTVPVSGAAVGTSFLATYIKAMHNVSERFIFHVVSREAPFTKSFLQTVSTLPYVKLHTSPHDITTVDTYEQVFKEMTITLEITKPSEQAFKALATPKQRGGVILLFAKPVGGQEYDNLHFLRNHGLIPGKLDNRVLWQMAEKQQTLHGSELLSKAHHWRGVRLPDDPEKASAFTSWCLKERLFFTMLHYRSDKLNRELQSNGVEQFWLQVAQLIEEKQQAISVGNS